MSVAAGEEVDGLEEDHFAPLGAYQSIFMVGLGGSAGHLAPRPGETAAPPALQMIDRPQTQERDAQHHAAQCRCAVIVVLLQTDDDQHRGYFGLERQVAGDEDHRAVFPDRAGKCQ